ERRFSSLRCNGWQWFRRVLAAAGVLFAAGARAPAAADDPAPAQAGARRPEPHADDTPIPIILNGPAGLPALLKALDRPDFVILRGDEYDRRRRAGQAGAERPAPPPALVTSVSVRGTVRGELAELTVDFGVVLGEEGPAWVALGLDGQTLKAARDL